jgi:hypothetical protein
MAGETRRACSADEPRRSSEPGAPVVGAPPAGGARLAEVQEQLYDLITAPEGVGKRLAELGRAPRDLEALVRSGGPLSAVERVDVYADMYFYRIRDVLADEYAKLVAVMGDGPFHNVVTDYLLDCRPAHPSLRQVGARLPGYLARHPIGEDPPWLAALARLERLRLELYDGPDAEPLTFDQVRVLPPEALAGLRLVPVPCHALLTTAHGISALWRALEDGGSPEDAPGPTKTPETILVWRRQLAVFHRALDQDEVACLSLLGAGASFASVCELLAAETEPEAAARRAFELLVRWLGDGLLAA